MYVDDTKLAGKKQNIDTVWKVLMKQIDLGEPKSFLDHVNLGCTERECETTKKLSTITKICSKPESPQEQQKNSQVRTDLMRTSRHGPMIWKVMQRNVWRYCELANRPSFQRRRIVNGGRNVKSLLSNCPDMSVLGTHW